MNNKGFALPATVGLLTLLGIVSVGGIVIANSTNMDVDVTTDYFYTDMMAAMDATNSVLIDWDFQTSNGLSVFETSESYKVNESDVVVMKLSPTKYLVQAISSEGSARSKHLAYMTVIPPGNHTISLDAVLVSVDDGTVRLIGNPDIFGNDCNGGPGIHGIIVRNNNFYQNGSPQVCGYPSNVEYHSYYYKDQLDWLYNTLADENPSKVEVRDGNYERVIRRNGNNKESGILLVNGDYDLRINGNYEFDGLIMVKGDLNINGDATINGAIVVWGNTTINGNATLTYDKVVIENYIKNKSITHEGFKQLIWDGRGDFMMGS